MENLKQYKSVKKLNEEKWKKINQLEQLAKQLPEYKEPETQLFLDKLCYYRYLQGSGWNIDKAKGKLFSTIKWRLKYKPWNVKKEEIQDVLDKNFIYHYGCDKSGRPIVYLVLQRLDNNWDEKNTQKKFRTLVWIMEQSIIKMDSYNKNNNKNKVYDVSYVIDLKNINLTLSIVKGIYKTFVQLGDYYTERLNRSLLLNGSWSINVIWKFLSFFLEPECVEKYQFCDAWTQKGNLDFLIKHIEFNQISKEYQKG